MSAENSSGKPGPEKGCHRTDRTDPSDRESRSQRLRPSGGYRKLRSFRTATVIYDTTVVFCARFLDKRSRTVDQMVQAARSGRQNIAEGSRAAATSSKTELRLINVARASLDELLLDYEDFLRQRGLRQWLKDDPHALEIRAKGRKGDRSEQADSADYSPWLNHQDRAMVANAVICLNHQANYLLDRQIAGLERSFVQQGGYTEQLAKARIAERSRQANRTDPTDPSDHSIKEKFPDCPLCGSLMTLRTARQGKNAGSQFWGCTSYPECTGPRKL
jgi:restriction system protein